MEQEEFKRFQEKYLKTEESKNYVKGILALRILSDAIAPKVDTTTEKQFRQHAEEKLECLKCENSQCKAAARCRDIENLCTSCSGKYHRNMKETIRRIAGAGNVFWNNSPESKIKNHCDFAKCFIPIRGYENINDLRDLDCYALMKIIINNKDIQQYFSESKSSYIFTRVYDYRNKIHHKELTLDSKDFKNAVDTIMELLTDQIKMCENVDGHQYENITSEESNEDEFEEDTLLTGIYDLETDAEPEIPEDENTCGTSVSSNRPVPVAASSENNQSGTPHSAGHRKKMEEAVEYLKKLKTVDFYFSTQDMINFLQETVIENKRKIYELEEKMKNQDDRLSDHEEKIRRLEMENKKIKGSIEKLEVHGSRLSHMTVADFRKTSTVESLALSRMPSDHWETKLNANKANMPAELQLGYVDALILYCEDDREDALKFKEHLQNDIKVLEGTRVEAILYDGPELSALGGSTFDQLEKGIDHSTYVFIYLTKKFVEDRWSIYSADATLKKAIDEESWRVIPVWTEKKGNTFKVPFGLNALNGIPYYSNDEFYRKRMSVLFDSKAVDKKNKNEENKLIQKKWLNEEKERQEKIAKKQRNTELLEGGKTKELKLNLEKFSLAKPGQQQRHSSM